MILELDDTIIPSTGLTPNDLKLELALQLYHDRKISLGQGGQIYGLGRCGLSGNCVSGRFCSTTIWPKILQPLKNGDIYDCR